jgi:hypothetical protein
VIGRRSISAAPMTALGHGSKLSNQMAGDQEARARPSGARVAQMERLGARGVSPSYRKEALMRTDPQGYFDGN